MLEIVFKYLVALLERLPIYKNAKRDVLPILRKATAFIVKHPVILYTASTLLIVFVVFNPEVLPDFLQPPHKCYVIQSSQTELSGLDGDTLRDGRVRPCDSGDTVAVEWYNYSPTITDEKSKTVKNLISGGIFIDGSAITPKLPDRWFEYTLFGKSAIF